MMNEMDILNSFHIHHIPNCPDEMGFVYISSFVLSHTYGIWNKHLAFAIGKDIPIVHFTAIPCICHNILWQFKNNVVLSHLKME